MFESDSLFNFAVRTESIVHKDKHPTSISPHIAYKYKGTNIFVKLYFKK